MHWRLVDEYIKTELHGAPGTYPFFHYYFRQWLRNAKGISASPMAVSLLLQAHKKHMMSSLYKIDSVGKGWGAAWEVCTPSCATESLRRRVDEHTRWMAQDFMWRALNIAKSDPAEAAKVEAEIRVQIAIMNSQRVLYSLPEMSVDDILNGTFV